MRDIAHERGLDKEAADQTTIAHRGGESPIHCTYIEISRALKSLQCLIFNGEEITNGDAADERRENFAQERPVLEAEAQTEKDLFDNADGEHDDEAQRG